LPELETMSWRKDGKIARITLKRTRVLNAMDNQATFDLNSVADAIVKEDGVRVVVIRGAGRAFSTGIDLMQLSTNKIDMPYYDRWERALRAFETMQKIVIAAIKQYCLGGGLQLALACDVRIAASNAILGLPGVKEGLIPGLATWRLPHYVGLGRAKRYILSGENIPARDALAIGLVDYVVPLGQFNRRVEEITKQYAKVCSVGTLQSKLMVNQSFDLEYETFRKKYLERQEIAQSSDDHYEARRAYLQKRDPVFK